MRVNYQPFVARMIEKYEGGYGWDAADPGGPTKFGITCFDLAAWRRQAMDSMRRWAPLVKAMSLQEAEDIYAAKYATACAFNDLNSGPDCSIFDFGVNSGPSRSIRVAQHVAGVAEDGILGPVTLAAINAMDPASFVTKHCYARIVFLENLRTWGVFGTGWSRRVFDLRLYCKSLIVTQKAAFALEINDVPGPEDKITRIALAFAKGCHTEDMPAAV